MEFTIRILVVMVLIVIAFVVFVALIGGFGANASGSIKGLFDWFGQLISGKATIAGTGGSTSGSGSGLPGLPTLPSGTK